MCARYTLRTGAQTILDLFSVPDFPETLRFNVCPTDTMPIIVENREGAREFRMMRWGLVPSWAKDIKIGVQMINARSETVFEKPAFRNAIDRRRCIVPADGFYEWMYVYPETVDLFGELARGKPKKQPYHIRLKSGEVGGGGLAPTSPLFGFAGIYEKWTNPADGGLLQSFSIITCEPNALIAELHDRMPVLLRRDDHAAWLSRAMVPKSDLQAIMTPLDSELMEMSTVGPLQGLV